jgi:hypothetical protein
VIGDGFEVAGCVVIDFGNELAEFEVTELEEAEFEVAEFEVEGFEAGVILFVDAVFAALAEEDGFAPVFFAVKFGAVGEALAVELPAVCCPSEALAAVLTAFCGLASA